MPGDYLHINVVTKHGGCFRLRQELATSPSCVTARQEGHRAPTLAQDSWAAPRNAPCLGLRMAMEFRALFLLPLCFPGLQGQAPEARRRREGDTLYIQCPYAAQTEDNHIKYWCLRTDQGCQDLVQAYSRHKQQSGDGIIMIEDDTSSKTVSITMTDLKAEQSGTYECGYYFNGYLYRLRIISLNVFRELLQWELDTVSVQCPRSPWGLSMTWCRRQGPTQCTDPLETQSPQWRKENKSPPDRAWIEYSNQQRVLTVTMKKLQVGDAGVYWCALGRDRTRIREVVLSVFKRTQRLSAKESGNVSVQCQYKIADYRDVSKAWCRKEEGKPCNVLVTTSSEPPGEHRMAQEGRVTIHDDPQEGVVTVTMQQLQAEDSGVYWCVLQERSGLSRMEEITLSISRVSTRRAFPNTGSGSEEILLGDSPESSWNANTVITLFVVLLMLLLLALVTAVTLGVRHYRLLGRTGSRQAEDSSDRAEGTAQPGSTGRRESSEADSKGPAYINLDVQSPPSPEDPLYCNVEPSQAHRNPQSVEYAVIAFNQSPRNDRG